MPFTTQRRVEFRDTDAAGIVHFSAFFPMMEAAEHEWLRSIDVEIMPRAGASENSRGSGEAGGSGESVTWPRVSASCDYRAAARFEDLLTIEVQVAQIGSSSVRHEFRFIRDGMLIAEGSMTAVCCRLKPEGKLEKIPIPEAIRRRLEAG